MGNTTPNRFRPPTRLCCRRASPASAWSRPLVRDARGAHDCIVSPTVKPRDQLPSLFTPEFYRNPYPAYATLRRSDPVHWDEEHEVCC